MRKPENKKLSILFKIISVAVWILLWQTAALVVDKELLIVGPFGTVKRLFEMMAHIDFWNAAASSLVRIMSGFLSGIFLGVIIAAATSSVRILRELFFPVLSVIKSTPVTSFIILALVWIKRDYISVFITMLMTLPIIWSNVNEGISKTDAGLLEMSKIFRFNRRNVIKHIYIPETLPFFVAGSTTALGFAWKSGIAAEVLCQPKNAIGTALYDSKVYLETADLFALTVFIIIMSMIFEGLLKKWIASVMRRR